MTRSSLLPPRGSPCGALLLGLAVGLSTATGRAGERPDAGTTEGVTRDGGATEGGAALDVTLLGVDAGVRSLDVEHGVLDEPLILAAGDAGAPTTVTVTLGGLTLDGTSVGAGLSLEAADGGTSSQVPVTVAPDETRVLRLSARGLDRGGTYRAWLSVAALRQRRYQLVIHAKDPGPAVGLRTKVLRAQRQFWELVLPFAKVTPVFCIPVDTVPAENELRLSTSDAESPKDMPADATSLPPGTFRRAQPPDATVCKGDELALAFGPVPQGHYAGVLDLNGEKLAVDITSQMAPLGLFVWIALGTGLATLLRWWRDRSQTMAENVRLIAETSARLDKAKPKLLTWYRIQIDNVLREAKARHLRLSTKKLKALLDGASAVADMPQLDDETQYAINGAALPGSTKLDLLKLYERCQRLSAREDADNLAKFIASLRASVQNGFRDQLAVWVDQQTIAWAKQRTKIAKAVEALGTAPAASERSKKAAMACAVVDRLFDDARWLCSKANDGAPGIASQDVPSVEPEHVALIEAVPSRAATILEWLPSGMPENFKIEQVVYCLPPAEAAPIDAPKPLDYLKHTLGLRAYGSGDPKKVARALEEVTIEVTALPEGWADRATFRWKVGDQPEITGGPRLTWLFEEPPRVAWESPQAPLVTLTIETPSQKIHLRWTDALERAESDVEAAEATASTAVFVVNAIGVLFVGACASLYWASKPVGSLTDVLGMVLAGFGVNAGTAGAPAALEAVGKWLAERVRGGAPASTGTGDTP